MSEYYRHSGKAPLPGMVVAICATLLASFITGVVYSYFNDWLPIIYVRFFATIAFGFAIGWPVYQLNRFGRIRNRAVSVSILLVGIIAGYYASWVADMTARFDIRQFDPWWSVLEPEVLKSYIVFFYQEGLWSFVDIEKPVHGPFLAMFWVAEFLIVALTALIFSGALDAHLYCEACERWIGSVSVVLRRSGKIDRNVLEDFANGNPLPFLQAPEPEQGDQEWYTVDLFACPACVESNYTTIRYCWEKSKSGGNSTVSDKAVVKLLKINESVRALLVAMGDSHLDDDDDSGSQDESPSEPTPNDSSGVV